MAVFKSLPDLRALTRPEGAYGAIPGPYQGRQVLWVGWPENGSSTAILRTRFQHERGAIARPVLSGGDSGADSHRAVSGLTDATLADLLESCPEPGDLCLGTRGLLPGV